MQITHIKGFKQKKVVQIKNIFLIWGNNSSGTHDKIFKQDLRFFQGLCRSPQSTQEKYSFGNQSKITQVALQWITTLDGFYPCLMQFKCLIVCYIVFFFCVANLVNKINKNKEIIIQSLLVVVIDLNGLRIFYGQ